MFGYKPREDGVNSFVSNKSPPYNPRHLNSECDSAPGDNPSNMNDSMQSASMANYNGNYTRNSYGMNDQHGGLTNASNTDFVSQNSQYSQYGQANIRAGYSPGPRGSPVPNRPTMPQSGMNMMGPNYTHNQQRFPISGPSIQQQGGPTPTLNQLLQNPNAAQRYQAGYGYDGIAAQKGSVEMASQGYNHPQAWGSQQRSLSPYQPMQQANAQAFRAQVSTVTIAVNEVVFRFSSWIGLWILKVICRRFNFPRHQHHRVCHLHMAGMVNIDYAYAGASSNASQRSILL